MGIVDNIKKVCQMFYALKEASKYDPLLWEYFSYKLLQLFILALKLFVCKYCIFKCIEK